MSCHKEVYSKSNVYLFDISRYNFDHETVRNVLDKTIHCCNDSGEEFICRFCHDCLKSWDNPKYPIKSIYLAKKKNEDSVSSSDKKKNVDKKVQVEAFSEKILEFQVKNELKERINKEAIWLYAELFSVITIIDSHDKIYTTSGLFFPIQPKVW